MIREKFGFFFKRNTPVASTSGTFSGSSAVPKINEAKLETKLEMTNENVIDLTA